MSHRPRSMVPSTVVAGPGCPAAYRPLVSTADLEHPSLLPSVCWATSATARGPGGPRATGSSTSPRSCSPCSSAGRSSLRRRHREPAEWLFALDFVAGHGRMLRAVGARRWPVGLALAIAPLTTFSSMASIASCIALFTVAVHRPTADARCRSPRCTSPRCPCYTVLRPDDENFWLNVTLGACLHRRCSSRGACSSAPGASSSDSLRDRAQRAEAEQELRIAQARRTERDRIAREMHDVLAHRISLSASTPARWSSGAILAGRGGARRGRHPGDRAPGARRPARGHRGAARGRRAGDAPERPQPTIADLAALVDGVARGGHARGARARARRRRADERRPQRVPGRPGGPDERRKHAPGCAVDVAVAGAPGDGAHDRGAQPAARRRARRRRSRARASGSSA